MPLLAHEPLPSPWQLPKPALLSPSYQVLQSREREAPGGYGFPACTQGHSALSTQRPSSRSCPSGSRASRQRLSLVHHHDSSRSHRSPGVVICSGLLAESSKDSFYDADLSVCSEGVGGTIYLHSSDEATGERVLFKAFQKGSHESRLKASPRKLKEFLFCLSCTEVGEDCLSPCSSQRHGSKCFIQSLSVGKSRAETHRTHSQ